jgi:hypothetical protein
MESVSAEFPNATGFYYLDTIRYFPLFFCIED